MADDRDPVEELAADYAERLRAGERPTVADYQARYPALATAIAELFPTIAALEGVRSCASSSSSHVPPPLPEHFGEFRVLKELGRGGMGVVYLAEQMSLGRRVAIKALPASSVPDAKARARFQREARLAANLAHPGIIPIHAVGEERGVPWFAMHLVEGVGLDQLVAALAAGASPDPDGHGLPGLVRRLRAGPVPHGAPAARRPSFFREVALLAAQAADAIHHAHRQGVLHRDVKPANLLLDGEGRVWVGDFGLAKAMTDADLTGSNDVVGTLRYLAPERFDGGSDERSDIYGLGLVLYELATGRPAFVEESRSRLLSAILNQGVPAPRLAAPTVPVDLERIIQRACARRAADRHGDAAELAIDLRAFAGAGAVSAATLRFDPGRARRRHRRLVAVGIAGAAVMLVVAGLAIAGLVRPPPVREPASAAASPDQDPQVIRDGPVGEGLPEGVRPPHPPRGLRPPGPRHPPGAGPPPGARPPPDPLGLGPPR